MATRVGFTGTQEGMSAYQADRLRILLMDLGTTEFHHGDCIGADAQADAIARSLDIPVVIHPPIIPGKRAFCAQPGDTVLPPDAYLVRNADIVRATDRLIATPRSDEEELRSGTWSTVRCARRLDHPTHVLAR